jgi:CTP:molybdopterin cytidylyltransferase MocA
MKFCKPFPPFQANSLEKIGAIILAYQPQGPLREKDQLNLLPPFFSLETCLKNFFQISFKQIVLVLGYDYHHILNRFSMFPKSVKIVIHRKPEKGLGSALLVGLQALHHELNGVVISKGDTVVEAKVLEHLLQIFEENVNNPNSKKKVIVPLYSRKHGFPWVVSTQLKKSMMELKSETTLDVFLKKHKKEILTVALEKIFGEKS